jgi:hypothetical protein
MKKLLLTMFFVFGFALTGNSEEICDKTGSCMVGGYCVESTICTVGDELFCTYMLCTDKTEKCCKGQDSNPGEG